MEKSAVPYIMMISHHTNLKKFNALTARIHMRLIDIKMLERDNHILKLKLEKAHKFIKDMGKWNEYKQMSNNETEHSKGTRDGI